MAIIDKIPQCERFLGFAGQIVKLQYPQIIAPTIEGICSDFTVDCSSTHHSVLRITYKEETNTYTLCCPGIFEKHGIIANEFYFQLLNSVGERLTAGIHTGLALHAGAVTKNGNAVIFPGLSGVGKSCLTAWFLSRSYAYLSDSLVFIDGSQFNVSGLPLPLVIDKHTTQHLDQFFAAESYYENIIEDNKTALIPWRIFGRDIERVAVVSPAVLIFPEFRSGAEFSIEAMSPAKTALFLISCIPNKQNLPVHGLPQVSQLSRAVPALRLIYGSFGQLSDVLDKIIDVVVKSNFTPAEFAAFAAPFNRNRILQEFAAQATPNAKVSLQPIATYPVPSATPKGPKRKLTIGMATYDDFDGVYFSVQSIRLYHPEILNEIEILVVDNHPDGPCATPLKNLDTSISGYRYIPEPNITGTAVRDVIFREASGDFVLCIDCHVLIVPGALHKLIQYIQANPLSPDLLQGPLIYDDLVKVSTHFKPTWQKGMYGVWETDERGTESIAPPFDIPMQGLGLFCCRKDAWPGFNPRFRGFGGEEGYIHEKIRQRGGRTLCLPFLRWLHRFERPMGVPYKNKWEDRIHNYLVGFSELGIDTKSIENHFSDQLGKEAAERICRAVKKEMDSPFFFFEAIYCITLDTTSKRWQTIAARFEELGIAERVRAFKAVETPENHHIGCALSHRKIIALAHRQQLQNVLVFEDDAIFVDNSLHHLKNSINELKNQDWNIFYLGGHRWGQAFPYAEGCMYLQRPIRLTCTHALAYNASVYEQLLEELPDTIEGMKIWVKKNLAIDQFLPKVESLFLSVPVIASQPTLLAQEEQPSDFSGVNVLHPAYKYDFSICSIFYNEALILPQWLEHHLMFGCQHFYLINNGSTDNSISVLQPYIDKGLVDVVDEPRKYRQYFAYNEYYLDTICRETLWIGVIDIDEFLYPRQGEFDIKEILHQCVGVDGLAVPWLVFGSSGLVQQPVNIVDSFVHRKKYGPNEFSSFKTIVRTEALAENHCSVQKSWNDYILGIHSHRLKPGKKVLPSFFPKDTILQGTPFYYYFSFNEATLQSAQLVINHYRTMSLEFFQNVKMKRSSACYEYYDNNKQGMKYFNENDINDIKDDTLKIIYQKHPLRTMKR